MSVSALSCTATELQRNDQTRPASACISAPPHPLQYPVEMAEIRQMFPVNHQTHHRGQVHTMLTMARGREASLVLDLVAFQRTDEYRAMRAG